MKNNYKHPIFIAAAWPYANGSLHLGHVAALIGADILARYFRLAGHEVLFVSGSDCHGTPIAVEAEKQGISPQEIAEKYHAEFTDTLINGLKFSYDNYTTTMTSNHEQVVQDEFLKLFEKGLIYKKTEELPYCPKCSRFLPDRYIEGVCPYCAFTSARGDQCDNCGKLLDANQLIRPVCKICGTTPEWKESEHFFLKLSALQKDLEDFAKSATNWRPNAQKFTLNFLQEGLKDRGITRDTDWGVKLPLPGYEGKRIYVWFEAVSGYLSAAIEWAKNQGTPDKWRDFWQNKEATHYYVHGKDNIPFHTVIWPAILMGQGSYNLPDFIVSSEYLSLEGQQFSKSRKWAVWLPDFLADFNPETLRYFLVANGAETSDTDFSWSEYQVKTNSELIGAFGNLVYRVLSFIKNNWPEGLPWPKEINTHDNSLLDLAENSFKLSGDKLAGAHFRDGLKVVWDLVNVSNKYLNDQAPWKVIKENREEAGKILAVAAQVIRCLTILIAPYLPTTSLKMKAQLGISNENYQWQYLSPDPLLKINDLEPLFSRVEDEQIKIQEDKLKN